jgi:hypothetical protein
LRQLPWTRKQQRETRLLLKATVSPPAPSSSIPRNDTADSAALDDDDHDKREDFLADLQRLAERASDPEHNPIAAAARVEEAWRRHVLVRHGSIANSVLEESHDCRYDDDDDDITAFNIVILAWSNCCQCLQENAVKFDAAEVSSLPVYTPYDAALRAFQLLDERRKGGIRVSTASYNIVLDTFANKCRHRESFDRVLDVFRQLKKQEQQPLTDPLCRPDVASWNAVFDGLANSDREDRIELLEELWKEMRSSSSVAAGCEPNTRTINAILRAYGRTRRSSDGTKTPQDWHHYAKECEEIFRRMTERPDATTYANLMLVHSRRGTAQAARHVESLFGELARQHEATGSDRLRPNPSAYLAVISAWASASAPESPAKAEEWLQRAVSDSSAQPNSKCYNACLLAWARSPDPARAAKVLLLLQQMRKDPKGQPNQISYLTALKACKLRHAAPNQQTAALKIASAVFRAAEMDSMLQHTLYAMFLDVVSMLLPQGDAASERDDISALTFRRAIRDGQVTPEVVAALRRTASAEAFCSLVGENMIGKHGEALFDKIPPSWSKNAR